MNNYAFNALGKTVYENLVHRYKPIIERMHHQYKEFSANIQLVAVAIVGLQQYCELFSTEQNERLIRKARFEDDYSKNVTLIGMEIRRWARRDDLTLKGKKALNELYFILEQVLRDALELYTKAELEMVRDGQRIYLPGIEGYSEHKRAMASIWLFQREFHLRQIDFSRGDDRAIIYEQPGHAGQPFGWENFGANQMKWKQPDNDIVMLLTPEDQARLKHLANRPDIQALLPEALRNPNVVLPPATNDVRGDQGPSEPPKKIGPLITPKTVPQPKHGILKTPSPERGRQNERPKKGVRFGTPTEPPLPSKKSRPAPPAPVVSSPTSVDSTPPRSSLMSPNQVAKLFRFTSEDLLLPPSKPHPIQSTHQVTKLLSSTSDDLPAAPSTPPRNGAKDRSSTASSSPPEADDEESRVKDTQFGFGRSPKIFPDSSSNSPVVSSEGSPKDGEALPPGFSPVEWPDFLRGFEDVKKGKVKGISSGLDENDDDLALLREWQRMHGLEPSTPEDSAAAAEARKQKLLARTAEDIRGEVSIRVRAYLGRRHDEYSVAVPAPGPPTTDDEDDPPEGTESGADDLGPDEDEHPLNEEDEHPIHNEDAHAAHRSQSRSARQRAEGSVRRTALLHWSGVTKARRQERIDGHERLRHVLLWAEANEKVPLSPSSIRAGTGLRSSLFRPVGDPEVVPPPCTPLPEAGVVEVFRCTKRRAPEVDPAAYGEAALECVERVAPRLEMTLMAFLFNQDTLRLFGGLVGEHPLPRDLVRMDPLLRELEVYITVCAHRQRLILGHLKSKRSFPTAVAAQPGDLRAARLDAEEDVLSASRRCFDYVAERTRSVLTYPRKLQKRPFAGTFGPRDRRRLGIMRRRDGGEEASALLGLLEEAEDWLAWCEDAIARWTAGWRPRAVEGAMLYVDEETQADVRRYKLEINQKRVNLRLVPVVKRRKDDEVYRRQQEHIRLIDELWKLTG